MNLIVRINLDNAAFDLEAGNKDVRSGKEAARVLRETADHIDNACLGEETLMPGEAEPLHDSKHERCGYVKLTL